MHRRPILLFDVMETLVVEPFLAAIPSFFGMTLDELLAAKHPTAWIEFEEGRISEEEFLSRFFLDGRTVDRDGLHARLRETYDWVEGMEPLVTMLHAAGYRMHALSNYSNWFELIEEELGISRYVSWTFVSCATGLRKPDERAYLHAADTLGVSPAECLFIDDRRVNVQAAKAAGMDAVLMTGAAPLHSELAARGIA